MKPIKKIFLAFFILSVPFEPQAKTQATPDAWKKECIGYFQISVPSEVEIGVVQNYLNPSKGTHKLEGLDNNLHADSIYMGAAIRTSIPIPKSSFLNIKNEKEAVLTKHL